MSRQLESYGINILKRHADWLLANGYKQQASSLTAAVGYSRMDLERKHMQTNKQKQYQEALNNTFNPAGYRLSNMTPTNIERRIITAVNIAIGDDGHRAKEILENWQQLMEMDDKTYFKQVKFYG